MQNTDKMRTFIIKFLYIGIWAAVIFLILKYALPLIMPFIIAFVIAFVLKPLINKLSAKLRWSRKLVSILVLTLVYLVLGSLIVFLGVRLVVYTGQLFGDLPTFYSETIEPAFASVSDWFDDYLTRMDPAVLSFFNTAADSISNTISSIIRSVSSWALNLVTSLAGSVPWFVVSFVMTIIASYFFVVDYYKVTSFFAKQLSANSRRKLFLIKDFSINVLFKFARAYLILMSITFLEVSVGLLILRVPHAFLIAFLTAIVDIFPVLGTGTILIPWAIYSLFSQNYFLGIGLIVMYIVITLVRQVLEPRVVGKQIGLYPLLTLLCMFIGARTFGFWGMFALPITLTIIIHLNRSGEIRLFKE